MFCITDGVRGVSMRNLNIMTIREEYVNGPSKLASHLPPNANICSIPPSTTAKSFVQSQLYKSHR